MLPGAAPQRRLGALAAALRPCATAAQTPTMLAQRVHADGLKLEEIPIPTPGPGQVLIEVQASSVNPVDYKIYEGRGGGQRPFPWQPGFDISGVVAAVGEGCDRLSVGDAVWADNAGELGAAAEFVAVDESRVGLKPPSLSHIEAATLPLVALTSLQTLEHGHVTEGSKVLIIGGSSGCGYTGAMMAVEMGAHVTATCSGRNVDFVKGLGVQRVIDYTAEDWSEVGANSRCCCWRSL